MHCRPVVVLAERDKEAMDQEVRRALRGYELEWHTRSGSPHSSADLERVAAGQAHTIVLLHPEETKVWDPVMSLSAYLKPSVQGVLVELVPRLYMCGWQPC